MPSNPNRAITLLGHVHTAMTGIIGNLRQVSGCIPEHAEMALMLQQAAMQLQKDCFQLVVEIQQK